MKLKKVICLIPLSLLFMMNGGNVDAASQYGVVSTNGGSLNVRSGKSTSTSSKYSLPNGSYFKIISQDNNWYYIEYKDNSFGYVYKPYVKEVNLTAKYVSTNGGNLNVRESASTNSNIKYKLPNNTSVQVISTTNGFSKILYNNFNTGYVSSLYLASGRNQGKIVLNVPSYKQFDSRWAYVTIGSYGKTMKQIGCLTTAMAMTESLRLNKTVTPVDIRNKFNYTASGSMYWPSNYTTTTNTKYYLTTIYNNLKQGKPTIVGAKNSSGKTHFVVVYGYNGNGTSSSSNYLIHDPGSSYRSTLKDFLNSYPNLYKLSYY